MGNVTVGANACTQFTLPFVCSLFRWSPSFCFNVLVTSFFPWLLRLKDARIATPTACSVHWRTRLVIQSREWRLALYPEMFEILENLDPPLPLIAGPLMKTNILFLLRLGFPSTSKRQKTCQKQKFSKSATQNYWWTALMNVKGKNGQKPRYFFSVW